VCHTVSHYPNLARYCRMCTLSIVLSRPVLGQFLPMTGWFDFGLYLLLSLALFATMAPRSNMWQFFKKTATGGFCNRCKIEVQTTGGNTAGLRSHLRFNHTNDAYLILLEIEKPEPEIIRKVDIDIDIFQIYRYRNIDSFQIYRYRKHIDIEPKYRYRYRSLRYRDPHIEYRYRYRTFGEYRYRDMPRFDCIQMRSTKIFASGLNIDELIKSTSDPSNLKPDIRKNTIEGLTTHMEGALRFHRRIWKKKFVAHKYLKWLNLPYSTSFVTVVFLTTKLLYLINICAQLNLMHRQVPMPSTERSFADINHLIEFQIYQTR
jgi:hypothetical protein